jgi:chromate transport protein ChrA
MMIATHSAGAKDRQTGSPFEVLLAFLKLGVTCFGGPIAHIGYFREEFVVRRCWLDEQAYADLVGLCQFLPGPASSQVGFAIGLMRAGYRGGLGAWTGFTLPSAIALVLFAYGASALGGTTGIGLLHGLKLVAIAIVAQAVWGMARTLCPDRERPSRGGGADHPLQHLVDRPDRGYPVGRHRRAVALPARAATFEGTYCRAGLAHRGARGTGPSFSCSSAFPSCVASAYRRV